MSQIATFSVRPGDHEGQDELNDFLRGHRVLQIDRVFADGAWAFCVEWLENRTSDGTRDWRARKIDYRETLDEATFARFVRLRERRKAIAKEDGIPSYMIMTDAQMAEAAKAEALTQAVLEGIEGFGAARLQKYGPRLLSEETRRDEHE